MVVAAEDDLDCEEVVNVLPLAEIPEVELLLVVLVKTPVCKVEDIKLVTLTVVD